MSDPAFQLGLRRTAAVLGLGAGLALIGVALGLLYLDVRQHAALELAIELAAADEAQLDSWQDPTPILIALACGSLGAALTGSCLLLGLFEIICFRRRT